MLNTAMAAVLFGVGLYLAVRVAAAIHFQQVNGYETVTAVSLVALLLIGVAAFLFRDTYKRWRVYKKSQQ
jgi:high-affinity Fe2+/Pb2+ permease